MIENENGVHRIMDGATEVYNSSTDQLFHYLPPMMSGSFTRPAEDWGGSGAPGVRVNDFSLGSMPAPAAHIAGLVRFEYSTGYTYLPPDAWFVAGGSFVLVQKVFQTLSGVWGIYCSSCAFATIYADGGNLRYREEMSLWDHYMAGPNIRLGAFTVHYRIFPAVFS
jgi:hypothetical protein